MSTSKQLARLGANTFPVYRAVRGYQTAERLRTDMQNPRQRTWGFASRVAFDAATDKVDGWLARYAGTTTVGGYLDQLADKAWYLSIVKQLVDNDELEAVHFWTPLARDIGTTALRPVAQYFGLETDAQLSGKIKMGVQTAAAVAACSPLTYEHPKLVKGLFDAATTASVASGLDILQGYVADLQRSYPEQPAAQLIVASTTLILPNSEA
jgi:phosphatidylglycerophosphate synthase